MIGCGWSDYFPVLVEQVVVYQVVENWLWSGLVMTFGLVLFVGSWCTVSAGSQTLHILARCLPLCFVLAGR